ncbi:MAG: ABC transporter ATP-binding protein [Polaromonas sp.]|uniref:ABC transporter ATP-binding protein n=1 Tax=Polaromonas sp. TaxID=1869339 RepID=UPI0025FCE3EF|nr:ABC transporter ATP-binding protein [Polaromonas sp.]MBI2728716.1 ABC transporter ATP-binding protein [Polaromonas sp.]
MNAQAEMHHPANTEGISPGVGTVQARDVSHTFEASGIGPTIALSKTSLEVRPGEFVAMVGPSGCGKTTLLNAFAGLVIPSDGEVLVNGSPVAGISLDVGYMFARDGLMPWRTALDNVAFGLEVRGMAKGERDDTAAGYLQLVGLGDFLHHRRQELSQGMRQRVALARTLATSPRIILMDEPFAALDAQTKLEVQDEFLKIWEQHKRTVVFVTHDIVEAITMADRIIVFSRRPGRIVGEFINHLPRPRSASALRHDQTFEQLRHDISSCLTAHSTVQKT